MLSLSQTDFVDGLAKKFRMENCHANVIPAEPGANVIPAEPGLQLSRAMAPKNEEDEAHMKEIPYLQHGRI
jgi:hypothetical protein